MDFWDAVSRGMGHAACPDTDRNHNGRAYRSDGDGGGIGGAGAGARLQRRAARRDLPYEGGGDGGERRV